MGWCVAQTKSQLELFACANLQDQGFRTYCPMLKSMHKDEMIFKPMFPGYIFVEIDKALTERWQVINNTRGVFRLMVTAAERPSFLPDGWVDMMQEQGNHIEKVQETLSFITGEQLIFVAGPLTGQKGTVESATKERVSLLLDLLGRQTLVYSNPSALAR